MTVESGTKFTQVPTEILTDARVSAPSRLLYSILKSYAWQTDNSFPGQKTLADNLGCSDRMVRTYLEELEACGLVTVEQRGKTITNKYFLTDKIKSDWKPASTHKTSDRKPTSAVTGSTVPLVTGSQLPTNNTQLNNTQIKNTTTPLPPREKPAFNRPVVDEKFELRKTIRTLIPGDPKQIISGATNSRLHELSDNYPAEWVLDGYKITADAGKGLSYLGAILDHWTRHGKDCRCVDPKADKPTPVSIQSYQKPKPFEQPVKVFNPESYGLTPRQQQILDAKRAKTQAENEYYERMDRQARELEAATKQQSTRLQA